MDQDEYDNDYWDQIMSVVSSQETLTPLNYIEIHENGANIQRLIQKLKEQNHVWNWKLLQICRQILSYYQQYGGINYSQALVIMNANLRFGNNIQKKLVEIIWINHNLQRIKSLIDIDLEKIYNQLEYAQQQSQQLQQFLSQKRPSVLELRFLRIYNCHRSQLYNQLYPYQLSQFYISYKRYGFCVDFLFLCTKYLPLIKQCKKCRKEFKQIFQFEGGKTTEQPCLHENFLKTLQLNAFSYYQKSQNSILRYFEDYPMQRAKSCRILKLFQLSKDQQSRLKQLTNKFQINF